jgi:dipeptidyl aminopeptidase/acylaminoacyl peptidase
VDARRPCARVLRAQQRRRPDSHPLARDPSRARASPRLSLAAVPTPYLRIHPRAGVVARCDAHRRQRLVERLLGDDQDRFHHDVEVDVGDEAAAQRRGPRSRVVARRPHDRVRAPRERQQAGALPRAPGRQGAAAADEGRSPSWSPDGKHLAFVLRGSVYEIRTGGAGRKRVLRGLRNPVVRWSPDGRRLLYTSGSTYGAKPGDVWTADVDGTHRRRILHGVTMEGIAWRPGS